METFKTYLIIALIGVLFVIIRHIPALYLLDFKTTGLDIFDKIIDALWVAIFISLLVGHLIEKASYEKIKNAMRDTSMNIEKTIHDALEDGRNILKANEDATVRSQKNIFVAAFRRQFRKMYLTQLIRLYSGQSFIEQTINIHGD